MDTSSLMEQILSKDNLNAEYMQVVRSRQAADRVMKSVTRFIEEKLGLRVNAEKSKVDKPKGSSKVQGADEEAHTQELGSQQLL